MKRRDELSLNERRAVQRALTSFRSNSPVTTLIRATQVVNRLPMPSIPPSEVEVALAEAGWYPGVTLAAGHLEALYANRRHECMSGEAKWGASALGGESNAREVFLALGGVEGGNAIDVMDAVNDARVMLGIAPIPRATEFMDASSDSPSRNASPVTQEPHALMPRTSAPPGSDKMLLNTPNGDSLVMLPTDSFVGSPIAAPEHDVPVSEMAVSNIAAFEETILQAMKDCGATQMEGTDGHPIIASTPRDEDVHQQLPCTAPPRPVKKAVLMMNNKGGGAASSGTTTAAATLAMSRRSLGALTGGSGVPLSARSGRSSRSTTAAPGKSPWESVNNLDDVGSSVADAALHDDRDDTDEDGEGESPSRALLREMAAVIDYHYENIDRIMSPPLRALVTEGRMPESPRVIDSVGQFLNRNKDRPKPTRGTAPSMVERERKMQDQSIAALKALADRKAEDILRKAVKAAHNPPPRPASASSIRRRLPSGSRPASAAAARTAAPSSLAGSPPPFPRPLSAATGGIRRAKLDAMRDEVHTREQNKFVEAVAAAQGRMEQWAHRTIDADVRRTKIVATLREHRRPRTASLGAERHASVHLGRERRDELRNISPTNAASAASFRMHATHVRLRIHSHAHGPLLMDTHGPTMVEVMAGVAEALAPLPPGTAVTSLRALGVSDEGVTDAGAKGKDIAFFSELLQLRCGLHQPVDVFADVTNFAGRGLLAHGRPRAPGVHLRLRPEADDLYD
jgi:hypothetical protein